MHRYLRKVLDLYLQLPETPGRYSRTDAQLAGQLYERNVSAEDIEVAMLLATARRSLRRGSGSYLGPIRSLHYFLPVLEEIAKKPVPKGYLEYLRKNLQPFLTKGR